MRNYLLILSTGLIASCGATLPRPELVPVKTEIPAELIEDVAVPRRPVRSVEDLGVVLADQKRAIERANTQFAALRCINSLPLEATADQVGACVNGGQS
ncbi:MAG: hypothetical protein AAFO97_14675 [Pseudomonadota bacterium]